MKIVISTLCGEILAREEDTVFPPLLKILSKQEYRRAGIPYEPPQKEEEIGLGAFSTNQANPTSQNYFLKLRELTSTKQVPFLMRHFQQAAIKNLEVHITMRPL